MTYIHKLGKLFLYAGAEKEEYRRLLPDMRAKNLGLLKVFSLLGAVMFFALFIAGMVTGGFAAVNTTTYLACGVVTLAILVCSCTLLPKYPALTMLFVYLFELLLYVFGIRISLLHAEKPAVSAVAFLLVSPLLFYDRPVRMSALIGAVVAVFCVIVRYYKQPDVVETDVWNMITFGILAIITTVFMMSIKLQALVQSGQIEYMSRTDLLTGVRNRNHFENLLQKYPEMCRSALFCVYADVNGLHEMNNTQGHPAGDKMLREFAEALQRCFREEHTYRVGGDEFVAFRPDGTAEGLSADIALLKQELSAKGYHVSFGTASREKGQGGINMQELVSEAESAMFADKRAFYRQAQNDRRSR